MRHFVFEVRGQSMWPYLKDKDLVLVDTNIAMEKLNWGSVVLLYHRQSGRLLVHRYLKRDRYKGDSHCHWDQGFVVKGEVQGRLLGEALPPGLDRPWLQKKKSLLNRAIGLCSYINSHRLGFLRWFGYTGVIILGQLARWWESFVQKNTQKIKGELK